MQRTSLIFLVASALVFSAGCAGSGSSGSVGNAGGIALEEFTTTLPDGSPMEIEILSNHDGIWEGEFAVGAETGPYAHQVGTFQGTSENGHLSATCECNDGTEFTLAGRELTNGSLTLTRSDIPGTVLTFQVVAVPAAQTRADASFTIQMGGSSGSSGVATISTTPASVNSSMSEYRGKWRGLNITLWIYTSGYCNLIVNINDFALNSVNFASYKLSDVGTKTTASVSGYVNVYNAVTREITKYVTSANLSP